MLEINIENDIIEFRRNMLIVAIMTLFFWVPFFGIVPVIILFVSLGIIQRMNYQLNNPTLEEYRSKLSTSLVFRILAMVSIWVLMIGGWAFGWFAFIPGGLALIFMIVAGALEMGAWENFRIFLEQNTNLIQYHDPVDMIEGSESMRKAGLCFALSFLVIPIFIGWIFSLIGYFKLGTLNVPQMGKYKKPPQPAPMSVQQPAEISQHAPIQMKEPTSLPEVSFCPNCGAQIRGVGYFCGECGSKIKDQ